jgi:hypothetical protein
MICEACKDVIESPDTIHVIRPCPRCGRELRIAERGAHGLGLKVEKGDRLVVPSGALTFSPNPLKSSGHFTKAGLQWYAELITVGELPNNKDSLTSTLESICAETDRVLKSSPLLFGLDLVDSNQAEKAVTVLSANRQSAAWWAMLTGTLATLTREAIANGDANGAAWAAACMERTRAMLVFKEHLEDVVHMGHSAKRIVDILKTWEGNKKNGDEGFWQTTFSQSTYVLSQVIGVPVVFIQDQAYVGGMSLSGKDARFVDYLFAVESSREAVMFEIKTPAQRLLGRRYRGIYRPSPDLTGSVVQVLDYRTQLVSKLDGIAKKDGKELRAFQPRCVLLIGNAHDELTDETRRRSFELFRSNQREVEIITYDELFRKVEILATLFDLVRMPRPAAAGI